MKRHNASVFSLLSHQSPAVLTATIEAIYRSVCFSTVHIATSSMSSADQLHTYSHLRLPFKKSCSGILMNKHGYLITTQSTIASGEYTLVHLIDGRTYHADIIGYDHSLNIAVLKINGKNLPYTPINYLEQPHPGDFVCTVGNPTGTQCVISVGMINGLYKKIILGRNRLIRKMIQVDADVNLTNIGGPLVDMSGKLVGINSFTRDGMNFCTDLSRAYRTITNLIGKQTSFYALMGITATDVYIDELQRMWYTVHNKSALKITEIAGNGVAAHCGLKKDDIIVTVNNTQIAGIQSFRAKLDSITNQSDIQRLVFQIIRGKKLLTIQFIASNLRNN